MPLLATLLVGLLFAWLVINFVKSPAYFVTISFIGLTNGALYALVALGYTLVYGILELINFAHGDVFMLGSMFTATMILSVFHLSTHEATAPLIGAIVGSLLVSMAACGLLNAAIERVAVPAAARCAEVGAVDHCDRHLVHPRGRRPGVEGLRLHGRPQHPPEGSRLLDLRHHVHVGEADRRPDHHSRPARARLARQVDAPGQGDARDGAGPRRRGDDGHRRRTGRSPSPSSSPARSPGAAGLVYALYFGQIRFDTGFSLGLIAFTAAVLGGIGNLPGAVLGALCIGFIQAFNEGLRWHTPGSDWTQSIVFSILILILVFRPEGLLGERTAEGA